MSDPEPYGFERAAGGKSLLFGVSGALDSGAETGAWGGVSSLLSAVSVGTSLGVARTERGALRLRSTDKLSSSTTRGALLAVGAGS